MGKPGLNCQKQWLNNFKFAQVGSGRRLEFWNIWTHNIWKG